MSRTMTTALLLTVALPMALAATPPPPKAEASPAPAPAAVPVAAPSPAASPAAPAPAVVVKTTEPIHALVVSMKGSYMQHGDAFMQLGTQLRAQGKEPVGPPFGRYFNSMREVAEAELLWEVGFPVGTDVKATAPIELKDIPGGLCATLAYQGAPDGIEPAMTGVITWVTANGYRPTGTLTMVFLGEPGPSGMQVELRLPVEKTK